MKQRILATFLSLCLLVGLLPTVALAEESPASETQGEASEQQATATDSTLETTTDLLSGNSTDGTMSGTCGATEQDNVRWTLNKNGETVTIDGEPEDAYTLTISGTGAMMDYSNISSTPWVDFRSVITHVDLTEGLTTIGSRAFSATAVTTCRISSTVQEIKNDAFSSSKLAHVEFAAPSKLESIGAGAFWGTSELKMALVLPDSLKTIGNLAFQRSGITSVKFGENLKTIGASAFCSCPNLTGEVYLPDSLENLGNYAFNTSPITSVRIGPNIKTWGGSVFNRSTTNPEKVHLTDGNGVLTISGGVNENTVVNSQFAGLDFHAVLVNAGNELTFKSGSMSHYGTNIYALVFLKETLPQIDKNAFMNTSPTVIYGINNEIISWSSTASPCLAVTNGGTFGKDTVFETGTLATPTKDGAIFEGWYTKDGTGDDRGEKVTVPSAGQTYYAKWIDLGFSDVSLQYQGTQTFAAPDGVTFSNWQSEDSGIARVVDGTITAVNVGETTITATATCNGNAAEVSIPVKVTPRVLTYTLAGGDTGSGSITYNYSGGHHALADSLTFKWKDDPNTVVELEEGTDINYTYTVPKTDETPDGGTALTYDYLPMPVGNYDNVKFNLLNENYTFGLSGGGTHDYLEIDVHVVAQGSQRAYLASAAPKADQNFVYTGQGVLPVEGTLNAYADNSTNSDPVDIGTFTVNIEGLNDTSFHSEVSGISTGTDLSSISGLTLPTKPGTYIITASAEGNGYYLYKSLVFTINKATVTVKADDQLVYVGDEMPQFTYTVSGLVGTDTLNGTVSFACDATDTDEAGTYPITPSGANVPNTELYNDDIEYETGTLTIRKGSSSGGASHPEAGSTSSSSSSDRYEISKPSNVENGSIKISNSKAEKGDTITITVTPDEGYELDELAVYDEDGDEIDLEDAGDGKYTFEMPEGEVEIEASFVAIVEAPEADFDDVPVDAWYAEAVQYVFANNLMTGVSENSFAPNAQMNRAMVAQILFNMEQPSDTEAPAAFRDVDSDAWYAEAVNWAVWQGYMSGYGTGSFGPNDALTREQLVTVLWRYSGSPVTGDPAMLNTFSDAALTSDYAQQAMIWAYDQGVIGGNADGTLNPRGTATRAEIAQILMNYCENVK
ncbi:hypothetical protein B5F17_11565 [Butyricicoccus pullicaecorum]|uniref:SLH domain-containing protein n=2 Tax=Butyricicoccus pullicaecorum TaxID=501571 RepID=A0A1Y4L4P5_9FIRM|nr:hypothetical protein B5F17_11565 [Butyricicoccus pullicaecorum]